jgi:hypothetical protein
MLTYSGLKESISDKREIFGWFREFRERLERRHIDARNSDSYNSTFHRWIRTIFGYVFLLHVLYIFTGGIFYINLCLRDIAKGEFLEKYTSKQSQSPTVFSFIHRWIGL